MSPKRPQKSMPAELARLEEAGAVLHWAEEAIARARREFAEAVRKAYPVNDSPSALARIAGQDRSVIYEVLKAAGVTFGQPPAAATAARRRGGTSQRASAERAIRDRLEHMRAGEKLPTARALAEILGVSDAVVSLIIKDLAAQGLVTTKPGVGAWKADEQ